MICSHKSFTPRKNLRVCVLREGICTVSKGLKKGRGVPVLYGLSE